MVKEGDVIKSGPYEGYEVISVYTRAQALHDGVLIDVSEMAKEAGFKYPVAVTSAVWDTYIVPAEKARKLGQSENGRLWDTLWMLRCAIKGCKESLSTIRFRLYFIMKEKQRRLITLKAVCGLGDDAEPVLTIMMPEED